MPSLLLAGVPPLTALGTNKFQGLFGSGSACFKFWQANHLNFNHYKYSAVLCLVASILGASVASYIPQHFLSFFVPFALLCVALFFIFQPHFNKAQNIGISPLIVSYLCIPFIGFYDGIFGPGAGSFYMMILIGLGGFTFLKATAYTKFVNFSSNMGGFILFASINAIDWKIGGFMAVGQFLGARIGAGLALQKGEKLIRPLLIFMTCGMSLKLIFDRV